MKIIARPQCTEKTKELIAYSLEHDIPIFCMSESKRRSLYEKSMAYFCKPVRVICAEELLYAECDEVLIDDIEQIAQFLLDDYYYKKPVKLAGFTVTTEN